MKVEITMIGQCLARTPEKKSEEKGKNEAKQRIVRGG